MKDNVTKIIYALLAIVCATVGVEFLPSSPIDFARGLFYASRYMSWFSWTTLALITLRMRRDPRDKWLAFGLLALCSVSICKMIPGFPTDFLIPVRFFYNISFLVYAMKPA